MLERSEVFPCGALNVVCEPQWTQVIYSTLSTVLADLFEWPMHKNIQMSKLGSLMILVPGIMLS